MSGEIRAVQISKAVRRAWVNKYGECFQGNGFTIIKTASHHLAKRGIKHSKNQVLLTLKDGTKAYHWWIVLNSGLILDPAAWYKESEVNTFEVKLDQLGY